MRALLILFKLCISKFPCAHINFNLEYFLLHFRNILIRSVRLRFSMSIKHKKTLFLCLISCYYYSEETMRSPNNEIRQEDARHYVAVTLVWRRQVTRPQKQNDCSPSYLELVLKLVTYKNCTPPFQHTEHRELALLYHFVIIQPKLRNTRHYYVDTFHAENNKKVQ